MNISAVSSAAGIYASTGNALRSAGSSGGKQQLTSEELAAVRELQARDREVRQHEQAHVAAGGGLVTAGASYTYQRGPDGVNYAVGGEVQISTASGRTPDETIQRAQQVRAAALAPANPSGQDRAVAAQATQMEQNARLEKAREAGSGEGSGDAGGNARQSDAIRAYSNDLSPRSSGLDVFA